MEEDMDKKLDKILELTEENNHMLRQARNSRKWANLMRIIYWILFVVVSYSVYTYTKPYLDSMKSLYDASMEQINAIKNFGK